MYRGAAVPQCDHQRAVKTHDCKRTRVSSHLHLVWMEAKERWEVDVGVFVRVHQIWNLVKTKQLSKPIRFWTLCSNSRCQKVNLILKFWNPTTENRTESHFPSHIVNNNGSLFRIHLWMKGLSCHCVYFCVWDVPPPPFPTHPISFLSSPYKNPRNPSPVADLDVCPHWTSRMMMGIILFLLFLGLPLHKTEEHVINGEYKQLLSLRFVHLNESVTCCLSFRVGLLFSQATYSVMCCLTLDVCSFESYNYNIC